MTSRQIRKTTALAVKAGELAIAVPQVVTHRVARMAIAGTSMSERDRKEVRRMVDEKRLAFTEALVAMTLQTVRINQALAVSFARSFWFPVMRGGRSPRAVAAQLQGAALDILAKGIAPVHRKAVSNARRLARTKLR